MSMKERLIMRRVRQEIKDERDHRNLSSRPQVGQHKRESHPKSGVIASKRVENKE